MLSKQLLINDLNTSINSLQNCILNESNKLVGEIEMQAMINIEVWKWQLTLLGRLKRDVEDGRFNE